ncbi:hypothetical protein [Vibrio jasicida]|uniref:hypothetical protein n=1 Tax=Vibrio jasicida TaxID=766224 RepID=UPI000CE51746|nr:hypothetical protein [Vibrio jasicida]
MYNSIKKEIAKSQSHLNLDYFALLRNNTNDISRTSYYSSNEEWGEIYYGNNLLHNCGLVKYGLSIQANSYILPWYSVPLMTKDEKIIADIRRLDFGIKHGISFVSREGDETISIALGTSYNSMDFYNEVCNNEQTIRRIVETLKDGFIGSN